MKKILLGAAALSLIAAPAFAQSAGSTSTVNITGNVTAACSAALPTQTIDLNAQLGGSMIDSDGFPVAGLFTPGSIGAWTGNASAWCNGVSSRIAVGLTPLFNATGAAVRTPAAGFDHVFNLEMTGFQIGGRGNVSVVTNRTDASSDAPAGPFAGPMTGTIRVLPMATGIRPIAGTYTGQVRVTVSAN